MCLKLWDIEVIKKKNPLNEWNVILIYYVMDFVNPKNCNYFQNPF
jgi:hypothetical protein